MVVADAVTVPGGNGTSGGADHDHTMKEKNHGTKYGDNVSGEHSQPTFKPHTTVRSNDSSLCETNEIASTNGASSGDNTSGSVGVPDASSNMDEVANSDDEQVCSRKVVQSVAIEAL